MRQDKFEIFRLEDRVLFEAAAAAEIVEAAEAAQDNPNANVNEGERQAQAERDALKNVPPENPAAVAQNNGKSQADPSEISDIDALIDQLVEGELPVDESAADSAGKLVDGMVMNTDAVISTGKELVVISGAVPDKEAIISSLKPNQDILILENGNGLKELNDYLDGMSEVKYDAIHLISHGETGKISVNGEQITAENFVADEWTQIGEHLTENGDILLYGCDTAASEDGQLLVDRIAEASGADVAASTDTTGLNGNWELEYQHGVIESTVISVDSFGYNLADTVYVTDAGDSGAGTLRWALDSGAANIGFQLDSDIITLDSDLLLSSNSVTIDGYNINTGNNITIQAASGFRVFTAVAVDIFNDSWDVTLENMTLAGSNSDVGTDGGVIYLQGASNVITLDNLFISDGLAIRGGGIYLLAENGGNTINISNSTFTRNNAQSDGGGIYADTFGGDNIFNIQNSTFFQNTAELGYGGAIFSSGFGNNSFLYLIDATVAYNSAGIYGGGIYAKCDTGVSGQSQLSLVNSIVLENTLTGSTTPADIYLEDEGAISFQAAYSIYGVSNIAVSGGYGTTNITGVSGDDIFDNPSALTNKGTLAISGDSVAAYKGTLAGIDEAGNMAFQHNGTWAGFTAVTGSVEIIDAGQNGAGRTVINTAYNIGAHALPPEAPSTIVTINTDITNPFDGKITLREAMVYYAQEGATISWANGVGAIALTGAIAVNLNLNVVDGFAVIGAGGAIFDIAGGKTLTMGSIALNGGMLTGAGNYVFSGSTAGSAIMASSGRVTYNAAVNQTVFAGTYATLEISGAGIKTLAGSVNATNFNANGASTSSYPTVNGGGAALTLINNPTLNNVKLDNIVFNSKSITSNTVLATNTVSGLTIYLTLSGVSDTTITYGDSLAGKHPGATGTTVLGASVITLSFVEPQDRLNASEIAYAISLVAAVNTGYSSGYTINSATGNVYVSRREITISGITAEDRDYNGTGDTSATLNYSSVVYSGKIGDDNLSVSTTGTFADGNAGLNKTVTLGTLVLGGTSANNYKLALSGQQTTTIATINKAKITISGIAAENRAYNGTADTSVTLDYNSVVYGGKIGDDNLAVSSTGAFADGNAGIDKTVTLGTLVLSGNSINNYELASSGQQTTTTATINKAQITISGIAAENRAYNGTDDTSVTLSYSSVVYGGKIGDDNLSVSTTGTFADGNAGIDKTVTLGTLVLSGNSIHNYELAPSGQQTTAIATINKAQITITGITAEDRAYNGTDDTSAALNYDSVIYSGKIGDDNLSVSTTGTFEDGNAGIGKTVTLGTLVLSGNSIHNYELASSGQQTTATATISKALITISGITAEDRAYNGTADTSVILDYSSVVYGGKIGDDNLSVSTTGALADGNAGVNKTVTLGTLILSGNSIHNYELAPTGQQATTTATINKALITIGGIAAENRTYNGTDDTSVTLDYNSVVYGGKIGDDNLFISTTGTFADGNAGVDKTVALGTLVLSGNSINNYELASSGQQTATIATINKAQITISGIAAENRAYNGTADTSVTLNYDSVIYGGKIGDDSLSVSTTGTFADGNAGVDKMVTFGTLVLSGNAINNYELAPTGQQTTAIATIHKAQITIGGITAEDRAYNGTTNADLNYDHVSYGGMISGDSLSIAGNGAFGDKNAGIDKAVTISGLVLGGNSIDNYELAAIQQETATATISQALITISGITAEDRVYNGTTNADLNYDHVNYGGMISGDTLSVSGSGAFADKNAGIDKAVTISDLTLGGSSSGNYELAETQQTTAAATISKALITISGIIAEDRTYNGTTNADLNYDHVNYSGIFAEDSLTISGTGAFADSNAGANKQVTITDLVLGGDSIGNYELAASGQQTVTFAIISKAQITISGITADDRVYNGTTNADLNYDNVNYGGMISGDSLSVSGNGGFGDKNAGIDKTVSISGLVLGGSSIDNYEIAINGQQTTATATISQAQVTISGITAENRAYNGTTNADLNYDNVNYGGMIFGDSLTISGTGAFTDKNAGVDKAVLISGLTLGGADAGNYAISNSSQDSTIATISKALISISGITAENRVYNGVNDKSAILNYDAVNYGGIIDGDSLSTSGTGAFADGNAGVNKQVMITDLVLGGSSIGNYELAATQQTVAFATVSKAQITISGIIADERVYNGTTNADLNYDNVNYGGMISGDTLSIIGNGTFADKNAEIDKTVSISDLTLGGGSSGNYELAETQQTTASATISKASVTISGITADDRVYNGTTNVDLNYGNINYGGMISGDTLSVTGNGAFADKNAGVDKTASISDLTLGGVDAGNYVISGNSQDSTTATISKALITISGIIAEDRVYNGVNDRSASLDYSIVNYGGIFAGDSLTVNGTGTFADGNAGVDKQVTISDLVLGGDSIGNYELAANQQTAATATINKALITISGIIAEDRAYNGTTNAAVNYDNVNYGGMISGDSLSVTGNGAFVDKNAGIDKTVSISDLILGGSSIGNYELAANGQQTATTATISKALITISGITAENRVYNGTINADLNYVNANYDGIISGDSLTINGSGAFANGNAGVNKQVTITDLVLGGDSIGNYELAGSGQQTVAFATISKALITISGITADDRVYNGTTDADLSYSNVNYGGMISGDSLTISGTGAFDDKNAGIDKTVSISGLVLGGSSSGNYELAEIQQTAASATISKASVMISGIAAENRAYDGTTNADLNYGNIVYDGIIAGDTLSVTGNGAFADKNAGIGKVVSISDLTLGGTDAGNYVISGGSQDSATATISKALITISGIAAENRAYNGTTNAGLNYDHVNYGGIISGDSLTTSGSGAFADGNAGADKTVTISNLILAGDSSGNYELAAGGQQTTTTATIGKAQITISGIAAENRQYDGSLDAALNYGNVTYDGIIAGDNLTVTATGVFGDKNAGVDKTVTIGGLMLGGSSIGNYELVDSGQQDSTTATISPRELTHSVNVPSNKTYDGSTTAYYSGDLTNVVEGDNVTLDALFLYNAANVATADTITTVRWDISGNDAGNYVLGDKPFDTMSGSISAKAVDATWISLQPYYVYNGQDQGGNITAFYTDVNGNRIALEVIFSGTGTVFMEPGLYQADVESVDANYVISDATATKAFIMLTVAPGIVNNDTYSEGLNWNYASIIPSMQGAWLARGGYTSPVFVNPPVMDFNELVSLDSTSYGIITGTLASLSRIQAESDQMISSLSSLETNYEDLFSSARGEMQSLSNSLNDIANTAINAGANLLDSFSSMLENMMNLVRGFETVSVNEAEPSADNEFFFHYQPVKMPEMLFAAAGNDDTLFAELNPVFGEPLPKKADAFKSSLELLIEELVGV